MYTFLFSIHMHAVRIAFSANFSCDSGFTQMFRGNLKFAITIYTFCHEFVFQVIIESVIHCERILIALPEIMQSIQSAY